ncbi:hypothetical protein SDC9_115560 [bioreactor metagenome]|uniref:Uncharacterized protein n=1 Tax=bioreactor metagenome TaxID=1076179 RepID=A0A645BTC4_9ZZZZ
MLVYLQNDHVCLLQNPPRHACRAGEVEVAVLIHGGHAHHGYVHGEKMTVISGYIPKNHGNVVAKSPVAERALIGGAVPRVIEEVLPAGVALHRLEGRENQVSPDFDIP